MSVSGEWVVQTGQKPDDEVSRFIRIRSGETALLGRADDLQARLFGFDRSVADRHVKITNRKGELTIKPLEREQPPSLRAIITGAASWRRRRETLSRLA